MSINKKIFVTAIAGLALGFSSCKKYLDVNTDPNVAPKGTVNTLLPAAQLYLGTAMGVNMQVNGSIWSQFWTQAPSGKEYIPFEQCEPNAMSYNNSWSSLYLGASNFYQLRKLAAAQYKGQYQAIAMLMQAYTFQALADGWGDVPFTEALQGQYAESHIVNPKYDSQVVVYRGILTYIDSAKTLMVGGNGPGNDDLVYGGNMSKWEKFANTLKLRALLRLSTVDPVYAVPRIDTLFRNNSKFIGEGDDAQIAYGANAGNNNPLYSELSSMELGGTQQLAGSKTCIDSLNSNNDYRGAVYYHPVTLMGLVGVTQSEYDIALPSGSYSTPNTFVGADAMSAASGKAPVMLLSSWESLFLQAEAFARGYATGDDAQMFYAGIHASFAYNSSALAATTGFDGAGAYNIYINGDIANSIAPGYWTMYPAGATSVERVRFIITQKWFAMCGTQGFEAWTETRRTGFPDFLVSPRNSHIGAIYPMRFLYPASEVATNSHYPGYVPVTTAVWWDKL